MSTSFSTVPKPRSQVDVLSLFDAYAIRYVRIQWVDLLNQRPGVSITKGVLGLVALGLAPGFSAVGEYTYVFDLSSFRPCHYAPRHAVFFGFFQEKSSVPRPSGPSFEVPSCPRTVLSRLLQYAAEELGTQFLVGFETEFVLLKSTRPVTPVNSYYWSAASAVTTGTVEAKVLEEIAEAIQADNIELQMYHAEAAPGQYEVVTGPLPPLAAADALVHTRETIYNIANKHGLRATFAPRLALDSCGSGAHAHISVRGDRPGVSTFEFLTPLESAFLSGLMHHLPSVVAFTLPLSASYARMADGIWSGGTWVCWGVENREAPVRLTQAATPSSRNFEIKTVDGTSNPYLALSGLLACGIIGIRDGLALAVKNSCTTRTAAEMSAAEREALGITKRMPLNVDEARRYLAADDAIRDVLGAELVQDFLNVNQMLGKMIDQRNLETRSEVASRLAESY